MVKKTYRKIKLTQGKYALVDPEDFEWLNQWKWYYSKGKHAKTGYAVRNQKGEEIVGTRKVIRMHRLIMSNLKNVDHINGNGIDNRKENLRPVNTFQQMQNRSKFKNKKNTKYKGVFKTFWGAHIYWIAQIKKDNKYYYLGTFKSQLAAYRAYIKKAKELHGEYSRCK